MLKSVMKKKTLFAVSSLFLMVSCSSFSNPWNDYGNQNNQNWNQDMDQGNWADLEETSPSYSGIEVEGEADSEDNVANTKFDGTLNIQFSENDVTVTGTVAGVTYEKNRARITVTNDGDSKVNYILSGTSSDGCFKLYSSKKQAITLNNLTLTNTQGSAINNQSKKRTFIVMEGVNTIGDGDVGSDGDYPEQNADEDMKAAIFSEGQLCFSGSGTLSVNAVGKAGITSDDYVRFMTGADVTVTSAKGHGVRGKDAILVTGGSVNVTLEAGATGKKCFSTDSLVYIAGGNTVLINKASAGTVDGELTGAAGIKADCDFVIKGGALSVTSSGKGCKCISGDADGYFEGGTVTATATGQNYGTSGGNGGMGGNGWHGDSDNSVTSKAVKFDGNLEFSGAEVTASSSSHEAIEAKGSIYVSKGTICAVSGDDAINSGSTMTIADGVIYACSTGNDGIDANGNLIIKGGTVYAVGCGTPETGIDANTESRYRLYIQGGNVISIGGIESSSSVSQPVISASWVRETTYSLCDGSKVLYTFKTPSSGGTGVLMTASSLVSGNTYSLIKGASVSSAEAYFDGIISTGGSASGGTSAEVEATDYTSGSGGTGGGGFGPGGGMGW